MTARHHPEEADLAEVATHLAGLSEQALAGAEADMRCFTFYIAALRRPHDDPQRPVAEADALADLIAVGENMISIADEARDKLRAIRPTILPIMANDIAAGIALIDAARVILVACTAESRRTLNP